MNPMNSDCGSGGSDRSGRRLTRGRGRGRGRARGARGARAENDPDYIYRLPSSNVVVPNLYVRQMGMF